ncbi:hypothetical protein [Burkholderia aenigmatica]|uniref:hypothetical protein n=1 Tax=Burkholderia aenigmatica TaxID=2015348 RepID=UPI00264BB278|nr:hypothetical protein [Burkholderia aenigmatica]MDN7880139.1 hypothetical protein [Burkholderia aenigmatica]
MHSVSKTSDEETTGFYREKEAQLARIGRMRLLRRSTAFQPATALAIGAFFLAYIAYHWLLSHFWRSVIGVPESMALVTAIGVYYTKKHKTYDDEIFAVLTKYRPVDTAAYLKLQERVRANRILSDAMLHEWLSHELEAIARAKSFVSVDARVKEKADKSPRVDFLNIKLGPSKVDLDDKDGAR